MHLFTLFSIHITDDNKYRLWHCYVNKYANQLMTNLYFRRISPLFNGFVINIDTKLPDTCRDNAYSMSNLHLITIILRAHCSQCAIESISTCWRRRSYWQWHTFWKQTKNSLNSFEFINRILFGAKHRIHMGIFLRKTKLFMTATALLEKCSWLWVQKFNFQCRHVIWVEVLMLNHNTCWMCMFYLFSNVNASWSHCHSLDLSLQHLNHFALFSTIRKRAPFACELQMKLQTANTKAGKRKRAKSYDSMMRASCFTAKPAHKKDPLYLVD